MVLRSHHLRVWLDIVCQVLILSGCGISAWVVGAAAPTTRADCQISRVLIFKGLNLLEHFDSWMWWHYASSEHFDPVIHWCSNISQKNGNWSYTAAKTHYSNILHFSRRTYVTICRHRQRRKNYMLCWSKLFSFFNAFFTHFQPYLICYFIVMHRKKPTSKIQVTLMKLTTISKILNTS